MPLIRNPTWVSTNLAGDITKDHRGTNFAYTEEEKKLYRENPEVFLEYRKYVERSINQVFKIMLSGSEENKFLLLGLVNQVMRERLSRNPYLVEKLILDYEIGCRRLSPGDEYLEAMQADNARFCFDRIACMTPRGIRTVSESGKESDEELDLITRRLDREWKDIPKAYFSLCAGGMPNYFVFGGPNAPIGHGSNPLIMAWSADYMLDWVEKIAREDIKSVVVRDSIVDVFNRYVAENLKRCVWSKGCTAWYSKKTGPGEGNTVTALYPGSALHYKGENPFPFLGSFQGDVLKRPAVYIKTIRGEHFDIRDSSSRWTQQSSWLAGMEEMNKEEIIKLSDVDEGDLLRKIGEAAKDFQIAYLTSWMRSE
ncbi:hypothetical protein BDW75DRAFT_243017 [Aspergillus navahoensis]